MFRQFLRNFPVCSSSNAANARPRLSSRSRSPRSRRLRLEGLEQRELLSVTTAPLATSASDVAETAEVETPASTTTDEPIALVGLEGSEDESTANSDEELLTTTVDAAIDEEAVTTTVDAATDEEAVTTTVGATDDEEIVTTTTDATDEEEIVTTTTDESDDETVTTTTDETDEEEIVTTTTDESDDETVTTTTDATDEEEIVTTTTDETDDETDDETVTTTTDETDEDETVTTTDEDEGEEEESSSVQFGRYDATTRSVTLSWTDDSGDETGYRIEYSTNGGATWRLSQITGRNKTSRTIYGVKPNEEYSFRVCELHGAKKGDWVYSETLKTTVDLSAPSDVATGKYDATTRSVKLSWTDNSNAETGFRIEYSTDGGKTWRLSQIAGRNKTSRTIYGVKPDAEYTFRVCALRGGQKGEYATSETLDTSAVFTAPTDVAFGTYNAKKRRVSLSWTDTSNAETGFRVEYSTDGGNTWRLSQIKAAGKTSCTIYGVRPNATYTFRVCALRGGQKTDWASSETLDTGANPTAPSAVTLGEYDADAKTVSVGWTDNSKDETGFQVEYTTDDGETWTLAKKADADATSITAENVEAGETYQFRVAALRNNRTSDWAYSEELETEESVVAPGDVTLGEYDADAKTVSVSWTDNSDDETGFQVEYTTDDGETWTLAEETDADETTITAEDVETGKTYQFRVAALRDDETSTWTVSEELDTTPAVVAPSDLTLGEYDAEAETVPMSWTDNSDDETGFRVEYTTDDGETWTLSEEVDADVTSRTAVSVYADKTYQFRVCAIREEEYSDWAYSEELKTTVAEDEDEEEDAPATSGVSSDAIDSARAACFENLAVDAAELLDVEL